MAKYWKYRSLENLKRFLDILVKKELYAAKLDELNDLMEGKMKFQTSIPVAERSKFKKEILDNCYVCSLSRKSRDNKLNGHMLALYADSHKGCCIELDVTSHTDDVYKETDWHCIDVEYKDNIPTVDAINDDTLITILSVKTPQWNEENETRFVKIASGSKRPKLKIKIERIYLGAKISKADANCYEKMIKGIDNTIDVVRLDKSMVDYGWLN